MAKFSFKKGKNAGKKEDSGAEEAQEIINFAADEHVEKEKGNEAKKEAGLNASKMRPILWISILVLTVLISYMSIDISVGVELNAPENYPARIKDSDFNSACLPECVYTNASNIDVKLISIFLEGTLENNVCRATMELVEIRVYQNLLISDLVSLIVYGMNNYPTEIGSCTPLQQPINETLIVISSQITEKINNRDLRAQVLNFSWPLAVFLTLRYFLWVKWLRPKREAKAKAENLQILNERNKLRQKHRFTELLGLQMGLDMKAAQKYVEDTVILKEDIRKKGRRKLEKNNLWGVFSRASDTFQRTGTFSRTEAIQFIGELNAAGKTAQAETTAVIEERAKRIKRNARGKALSRSGR